MKVFFSLFGLPWFQRFALLALVLLASFFYMPWIPSFFSYTPGLDESWLISLHYFFSVKKQFGTEVIFTYGPYGFLTLWQYYPATFAVVFSAYAFFFFVFAESAWFFLKQFVSLFWLRHLMLLGVFLLSSPPPDNYFFMLCVLAFLHFDLTKNQPDIPRNYLLMTAIALISLIKFTYFVIVFPIAALTIWEDVAKRRIPWLGLFFIAAYLSFWKMAGQNFSNLALYLRNSWEVASGYTPAMESPPAPLPGCLEFFYLVAAALLCLAGVLASGSWLQKLKRSLFFALISFLIFKGAFVRIGEYHSLMGLFFLPAAALLYLPSLYPLFRYRAGKTFVFLVLVIALTGAAMGIPQNKINLRERFLTHVSTTLIKLNILRTKTFLEVYQNTIAEIARRQPLPHQSGSSDIYSFWQAILLANHLFYAPRPVFQSYVAYTPRLANINAKHLARPTAAESIFFTIDQINDRLPALDDGLSWPELASRYYPVASSGEIVLLKKVPEKRSYHLAPLFSAVARWNEEVAIPKTSSGKVWVRIKIRRNLFNKILNLIYKPVAPIMNIETAKGTSKFLLIPSLAEAGFLLSPLITDNSTFVTSFYGPNIYPDLLVNKIKLFAYDHMPAEKYFEKEIEISFFELLFE